MTPVPDDEPNYLAHAFKLQYNIIGLGTALGFAVLSGSLLPLIVAAGVEMVVLPLLAGNPRFQNVVKATRMAERQEEAQNRERIEARDMLRSLPEDERRRYQDLSRVANEIRANYRGLDSTSQVLLDELVRKLEFLLSFYLRMRYSLARYDAYFATTDPERIKERIAMLDHELASGPERVQQIKARTRAVLEKRLERYSKVLENRQLIEAQTETVLEVLRFLRDQSFSIKDPRSIAEQLDGLVTSAESTERGVRDLEEIFDAANEPLGFGLPDPLSESAVLPEPTAQGAPPSQAAQTRPKVTQ